MSELVQVLVTGPVSTVVLNLPAKRNALSTDLLLQLYQCLSDLNSDNACRAIVLTGGGEHFCAGGDVSAMSRERPILGSRQRIESAHRIIRLLAGGATPTIAAVEGVAFGAGLSLAASCDYVVASQSAKFAAVFSKVGLLPDMGILWSLPQRIGLAQTKRLMFSARTVLAEESRTLGIADELVDVGCAAAAAVEIGRSFAEAAPIGIAITKSAYAKGLMTLEDALRLEVDVQPSLYLTQDHQGAISAFLEKRATPPFRGI